MLNKLINITYQLLDLGKRNRLLNYKDTGLKTLSSLNKNIEEIFRALKGNKDCEILDMDTILPEYKAMNNIEEVNKDVYYSAGRRVMDKRELIMYKEGSSLNRVLKSLLKDYKQSIVEKGINSLYASFGFIDYIEEGETFRAPLILIPIELASLDNIHFTIREYEDEILLNPTLRYYFNNLYNIDLPKYNDESLKTYLDSIREILPSECTLYDEMSIGIYSFYKMNMYNDLMTNKDDVIKNENIRRLLGDPNVKDKELYDAPIFPVVNCDSSQLHAIKLAAGGRSFCLQGPPGSGKSQTITNIISTLLGSGKKILFVSEKIAALRVVYENLRRVRLSDFAIELHSNKANKKEFIENLYQTAILPKYEVSLKTRFLNAKYDYLKSQLKSYDNELCSNITGMDLSLLDLYTMYQDIGVDYLSFNVKGINHNIYDLDYVCDTLEEYIVRSSRLGYDYRNSPIYGLDDLDEEYILYSLSKDLSKAINHLTTLTTLKTMLEGIDAFDTSSIDSLYLAARKISRIAKLKSFSPLYLKNKSRIKLLDLIEKYLIIERSLDSSVLKLYKSEVIDNIDELLNEYKHASSNKGFLNKNLRAIYNKINTYRLEKLNPDAIEGELKKLLSIKNNMANKKPLEDSIIKALGKNSLANLKIILSDLKSLEGIEDLDIDKEEFNRLKAINNTLKIDDETMNSDNEALDNIYKRLFMNKKLNIYRMDSNLVLRRLNLINDEKLNYTYYLQMYRRILNLKKYDAYDYLNAYLDNNLDIKKLAMSYRKEFLKERIDYLIENSPMLKGFSSDTLEESVKEFRALDEKILDINRDYIISELSQKRPTEEVLEGSEFKILTHEHEKLRRQMPIRSLLEKAFELILDIKPVFLMSPLSVSTYLASKLNMFDCVIFDEASQIFASDALGSIYRAKQCIIIGDTKQMPPSNFFHASMDYDDDYEYDLESILDKASNLFYTTSLRWHYRSRSEELISFSNQSFYDESLVTVPQAREHERGFGIDYYYIENGRYDMQTRTNPKEAEAICDMVFEHFKERGDKESLGVVAFSNVQAELIMQLIEKRLKKHPQYMKYLDEELDEPFFVKNLETVQGDERDRIIFSICYGYNNENKFYQRFGPLNNSGGERRLNVAITRAKYNVSVVASIKYSDIKEKTEARGVLLLRRYLEFAENASHEKNYVATNNGIINSIKEYVESLGFDAYTKYGSSKFKVDIAVKKDDKFIMAIMTDLVSEYSNNLTDKFRLEKLLLERLGWRYFKLYTTAWIIDTENEKERLRRALFNLDDEEEEIEVGNTQSYLKVDDSTDSNDLGFDEYPNLNLEIGKKILKSRGINNLIKEIIDLEAPIHREYIYNEVARIMDYEKPNTYIRDLVDKNLPRKGLIIDDFFYNNNMIDISLRVNSDREMSYIPVEELADGILKIVDKHTGISVDGAIKGVNKALGFEKLSANGKRKLLDALDLLLNNKRVELKDNALYKLKIVEKL